jgi:hypothetical protein
MRDPVSRADPKPDDAAIEDTRRFLEHYMQSEPTKADSNRDPRWFDSEAAIDEVEASNLPDWAKNLAILALLEQTKKKRRGRPKQSARDHAIQSAAIKLVMGGYKPTRNDATFDRASASSIICEALQLLDEKLSEKSINAIVAKIPASSFIKEKVGPVFFEWLREQAPDLVHKFQYDPNAPDIDPSVLK